MTVLMASKAVGESVNKEKRARIKPLTATSDLRCDSKRLVNEPSIRRIRGRWRRLEGEGLRIPRIGPAGQQCRPSSGGGELVLSSPLHTFPSTAFSFHLPVSAVASRFIFQS